MCNYSMCRVVMATVMEGLCVQSTMVEGTSYKMQIQPKDDLLPETIFTGCQCNVTMATILIKRKHYHCQVLNNSRYYLGLSTVAMTIIVIESM